MFKKTIRFLQPKQSNPNSPLFIFFPGMDGTGELLQTQLEGLEAGFNIRCLSLPPDDLTDWEGLIVQTAQLIQTERQRNRNKLVYLCGESFGGCLALQLAIHKPELFEYLILVNPATSFSSQNWMGWGASITQWLPESVYQLCTFGLLPFLIIPERVSSHNRQALLRAMQSVTSQTAAWRLSLLSQFKIEDYSFDHIKQPVLVIAGEADRILPSDAEAERLVNYLPNAQKVILPESGHACLLETEVKLPDILQRHNLFDSNPVALQKTSW